MIKLGSKSVGGKRQENQLGIAECVKMKCNLPLEFCFGSPLKIRGGFGTLLGV
jgi:hypothetical protein